MPGPTRSAAPPTRSFPSRATEVERRIRPQAPALTRTQLYRRCHRAVARVDPLGARVRHERRLADRRFGIAHGEDGMANLWITGAAAGTQASWESVDRLARSLGEGDPRTLEQRRVDVAHQLLQGTLTTTDLASVRSAVDSVLTAAAVTGRAPADAVAPPGAPAVAPEVLAEAVAQALARKPDPTTAIGRRPLIQVVVALDTLLGGERPADLVGHGPVPATTARALALGGVWQRLVTDPVTGRVTDLGRRRYGPPAEMADYVRARDRACRGCGRRIRDLDHHQPWAEEGHTREDNLNGYCRRCHTLKDEPGWQVISMPDGSVTQVSPSGRTRTTRPWDYRDLTDAFPGPVSPGPADDSRPPPVPGLPPPF